MEIHPVDATQRDMTSPKMTKSEKVREPQDTFSKSGGQMKKIGLSAEDISRVLLDKKSSDGMKDVKNRKELIQKIQRQIEAASPELEDLEKKGLIDPEIAKQVLLNSTMDPHVNSVIETDGDFNTKLIFQKNGTIVAGGGDGISIKYLTAYTPNGTVKWRSKDFVEKDPAVDKNGNFYFAKNNGTVSYDKDGNKRWQFSRYEKAQDYKEFDEKEFGSGDCSGTSGVPAIDEKRGMMYFGEWYGKIFGVEKDTGKVKWVRYRPGMIGDSDPTLDKDGNIFLHDDNGHVMSLKPNGESNWIVGVGYPKYYPRGDKTLDDKNTGQWMKDVGLSRRKYKHKEGDDYAVGTRQILIGNDQKVVFGTRDGRLLALNHDMGNMEMFFDAKEPIYIPPLDAGDGKVVFANSKGHIYCVDTKETKKTKYGNEMKLLWDKKLDKQANVELVGKDGKIYVSSREKGLLVYNQDGSVAWRAAVTPQTGVTEREDGSIWITSREKIMELKPLAERVEDLKKEGALVKDEETGELIETKPVIEVGESTVNIGGVVLERKKSKP
ncbi:MAG: PQQ-binding-like beta-propeller repeat protein [Candidatus Eremiobacteraeota bacterium]|nr:PQQ-binding-like beta-propeller repeat protein [Candidatus Eremiobacteraeota bacterium]